MLNELFKTQEAKKAPRNGKLGHVQCKVVPQRGRSTLGPGRFLLQTVLRQCTAVLSEERVASVILR